MKILFCDVQSEAFITHRLPLALAAKNDGHEVHIAVPGNELSLKLLMENFIVHRIELKLGGLKIMGEITNYLEILNLFYFVKPDLVHLRGPRIWAYGGIAARVAKVPAVISHITGLGFSWSLEGLQGKLANAGLKVLSRACFKHKKQRVIVQNREDVEIVSRLGCKINRVRLIRGSGVNENDYKLSDIPLEKFLIILPARMLKSKGVEDFISAARIVHEKYPKVRFALVGGLVLKSPGAISQSQIDSWLSEGIVEWWGKRNDMSYVISQASIVCLPSYYKEGVPKAILEAMSSGRPVIAANAPGTREPIIHNWNGILVTPRDPHSIARAIEHFIENPHELRRMGLNGKQLVQKRFTESIILNQTMRVVNEVLFGTRGNVSDSLSMNCISANKVQSDSRSSVYDRKSRMTIPLNRFASKSAPYVVHTIHTPVSANRFVVPIVERLNEYGYITDLWVPDRKSQNVHFKEASRKCQVHSINSDISINPATFITRFINIIKTLSAKKPNILHAHQMRSSTMPLLAAWMLRVPIRIYHNHGLPYLGHMGVLRKCLRLIERINIFLSTNILLVSHGNLIAAREDGLLDSRQGLVLGNGSVVGINMEIWNSSIGDDKSRKCERESLGISIDAYVVLFIGRPTSRKGFSELLSAWEMGKFYQRGGVLLCAGFSELDVIESGFKVPPGLKAIGMVANLFSAYSSCDVLCLPSWHEGLSYAVLEASAFRRPVIGTDIPGLSCEIMNGKTGILVPVRDIKNLSKAMQILEENPELRREFGEEGRKFVERKFNNKIILKLYIYLYEYLLGRRIKLDD
jgi:N,N'-diacetylbacillosaminyl-diphospho-undecaprenol alpha-1,3-N-acetylgalactosaminyltransferase